MAGPLPSLDFVRRHLDTRGVSRVDVPGAIQAAVAVVHTPGEEGLELLLIRRAERDGDPWSGQMGLPGGRMEDTDPDLLFTARRETREELAVDLPEAALLGGLDDLHPTTTTLPRIVVRPYVFGVARRPEIVRNVEVAACFWVSLRSLQSSQGESDVVVQGARRTVASYRLGENIVWGMTHRILAPLTGL